MKDLTDYSIIFESFLKKWVKYLDGSNYVVELGFNEVGHGNDKIRKEEVLCGLLNLSNTSGIEFSKTDAKEMKNTISKLLLTGGSEIPPSHFTKETTHDIELKMLPKYYEHIKHYVTIDQSNIYKLANVPDAPCFNVFWSYTYLISDHSRGTSIIVWGGAAD